MILFFALILSLDFSIRIFFDKTCSVSLTIIRIRMRKTRSFGVFFSSKGIQAWNFHRRSHDFHQGEIWRARFLGEAVKGEWRRETRLKPPFSSSNELHELRSLWTFFLVSFKRCSITHMLCALSLPKKGPFFRNRSISFVMKTVSPASPILPPCFMPTSLPNCNTMTCILTSSACNTY